MKKCKWCNSEIEDNATVCPLCKAEQSLTISTQTNHVEKFLKNHPNGTSDSTKAYKPKNKLQKDENYLSQIANDIRVIKNIAIIFSVLYLLGSLIVAVNILGL